MNLFEVIRDAKGGITARVIKTAVAKRNKAAVQYNETDGKGKLNEQIAEYFQYDHADTSLTNIPLL